MCVCSSIDGPTPQETSRTEAPVDSPAVRGSMQHGRLLDSLESGPQIDAVLVLTLEYIGAHGGNAAVIHAGPIYAWRDGNVRCLGKVVGRPMDHDAAGGHCQLRLHNV